MPQIKFLASLPGVQQLRFDYCQFGAPWEKPTAILVFGNSNFKLHEPVCASHCKNEVCPNSGAPLVPLSGHVANTDGKRFFRIAISEQYPKDLCSKWAQLIIDDYTTRTNSLPSPGPHHGHKLKWSDLNVDVDGLPTGDRRVLYLTEAPQLSQ